MALLYPSLCCLSSTRESRMACCGGGATAAGAQRGCWRGMLGGTPKGWRRCTTMTRSVCAVAAALASRRCAWGLEPLPRQALSGFAREAAVCHHNGDPLSPGLSQMRRHGEILASNRCRCRPAAYHQHACCPRLIHVRLIFNWLRVLSIRLSSCGVWSNLILQRTSPFFP